MAQKKKTPLTGTQQKREPVPALFLLGVEPKTDNQDLAMTFWEEGLDLTLHGVAGTGKTFLALYMALREVLKPNGRYKRVRLFRSAVNTRNQGFVPGGPAEKDAVYESPYWGNVAKLFGRKDAYDVLKKMGVIDFTTTSSIRGETWDDTIFIIDEAQNMTFHELDTVITRRGDNCRVLLCGDFRQCDLGRFEQTGINEMMLILDLINSFEKVEFGPEDIVRSQATKDYILAKLTRDLV